MSGGRLVVLDRLGRDAKAFALAEGSASIGSDPSCDIRVILPGVRPLHATVAVHANGTLLRAESGETLLNGAAVSVAALRHGDTLRVGGRALRWDYERPPPPAAAAPPCLAVPRRGAAARARRRSEPARRTLTAPGRDSAPASTSTSGKQVAIVQPQRRDTSERTVEPLPLPSDGPPLAPPAFTRKSFPSKSQRPLPLDDPTKASLWIESRKPRNSPQLVVQSAKNSPRNASKLTRTESPRVSRKRGSNVSTGTPKNVSAILQRSSDVSRERGSSRVVTPRVTPGTGSPYVSLRGSVRCAPLRLAVLKKAHSAQTRVTKIRAPLKIDHTKQAAIMLMTGHAARPRSIGPPGTSLGAGRLLARSSAPARAPDPPRSRGVSLSRSPRRTSSYRSNTQDIRESDQRIPVGESRSARQSSIQSPMLGSPKKSALKDPTAKKSIRKTESIKFDLSNLRTLSNLESYDQNISSDVVFAGSAEDLENNVSDEEITLHYSDTSSTKSPSPMKTVHSRSSRIIEKSLGSPMQTPSFVKSTLTAQSPRSKRSLRGSIIVQKALNNSDSRYSRRTTKSLSDQSYSTTITSRISESLSQRSPQNLEAYSIVDLVSIDSNESGRSIYNSVDSNSTASFGTPGTIRKTRSKNPSLLGSSTPYSKKTLSPKTDSSETTNPSVTKKSRISTRRSVSITTPENAENISFNSTKISRPSRSRSRINDSDVLLADEEENEESSPRSSRRTSKNLMSPIVRKNISIAVSPSDSSTNGTITPENRYSPQDIGTPMLSIQNLLDKSSVSDAFKQSQKSRNMTRRTIGSTFVEPERSRLNVKATSLNLNGRRSLRTRKTSLGSLNEKDLSVVTEDAVTPKSAVKLVQEAVKNKHSTAKKPHSKRSLIDDLDDSDFVKELFNSPVKRKLSQSMTEFSRKFIDADDIVLSRPTRNTVALTGRTPDNSLMNNTQAFTPEIFVSPISTPSNSPNLPGLKRLFEKITPDNDLRNVRGVKTLLRTPRARKSINNDLSNISGVNRIFCRSPRNTLSDVRVKEVFALSPTANFGRVSGEKALFQKSPLNDLGNISGVKRILRANTPRNNLSDVRGVKQLFREQYTENNCSDVSGVEELFDEPPSPDATFDRLVGRPRLRAYSKSNSCVGVDKSKKGKGRRGARSLHDSIGLINDNVEEWLENELKKRVQRPVHASTSTSGSNVTRELKKLHTDTVEGHTPPAASRSDDGRKRSASEMYSARKLPLKKRSLASPRRSREVSLPLKKRAVPQQKHALPHSTPLRPAARGLSMNASELARVSPIAADEPGILPPPTESPKPRAARGRKPKAVMGDQEVIAIVKPSPKRTRSRAIQKSPGQVQARVTRRKKTNDSKAVTPNKGRATVVIAKKLPVMSPKPSPKITRTRKVKNVSTYANNSKKISSARQKPQLKVTPKKTRAKVLKDTVVVRKPSPQVKLRSKRQIKERTENIQIERPKRTKTTTIDQNIIKDAKNKKTKEPAEVQQTDQIEPRKLKRGRKNAIEIEDISEDVPFKKRGRKVQEIQDDSKTQNKRTRKIPDSKITKSIDPEPNKTSRGQKEIKIIPKTGQRKVAIMKPRPVKLIKNRTDDKVIRKSRQRTKDIEDKKNTSNTKKSLEKPEKKKRASKKSVAESSAVETKMEGKKTRKTTVKQENNPAEAKNAAPTRTLRKRPALNTGEDTAVETKKRRTRRAFVQGTS